MIRDFTSSDTDAVLDIWLRASIQAHPFMAPEFWCAQLENMRTVYLPAAQVCVYDGPMAALGFYALHENRLAALFVTPPAQSQGIGKALLTHATRRRTPLTLSVYQSNTKSLQFYLSQGWSIEGASIDPATRHPQYLLRTPAA